MALLEAQAKANLKQKNKEKVARFREANRESLRSKKNQYDSQHRSEKAEYYSQHRSEIRQKHAKYNSHFFYRLFSETHIANGNFALGTEGNHHRLAPAYVSPITARACSHWGTTAYNVYVHNLRCLHFAFCCYKTSFLSFRDLSYNIKSDWSSQLIKYKGFSLVNEIASVKFIMELKLKERE